jgi:hypothetical protein
MNTNGFLRGYIAKNMHVEKFIHVVAEAFVDCQVKLTPFLNYTPKGRHFIK